MSGEKLTASVASGKAKRGISLAVGVGAQLVAVERQAGLQAQGVAGAEADGSGARADEGVPELAGVLGGDEELEAERLAGVAGAAEHDLGAGQRRRC